MKQFVAILTVALIALAHSQAPPVNMRCLESFCTNAVAGCTGNDQCSEALKCVGQCWDNWNLDPTPQKYIVQNCTNKCTYTYGGLSQVLICLSVYNCLHLPPIPSLCRGNDVKPQKNISLEDVEGTWWTLRGYNPAYDCFPCQNSTLTNTTLQQVFKAFLVVEGQFKLVYYVGHVKDNAPLPGFNVTLYLGLKTTSTFWPIDIIEDEGNKYILLYYCATENQWNYDGAYVVSSATTMSERAMEMARTSFKVGVGLELDIFCSPSLINCSTNED